MSHSNSPYHYLPAHGRESAATSSASSPITPTFSARSHNRWPSSTSSLVSNPDSLVNTQKAVLHDLVEDPAERDEFIIEQSWHLSEEPLCICDTPHCHHRDATPAPLPLTPEWLPGDDYFSAQFSERSSKRRRSVENATASIASRLSRRFPSISRPWTNNRSVPCLSNSNPPSAPPSRTSSLRLPAFRSSSTSTAKHTRRASAVQTPSSASSSDEQIRTPKRAISVTASKPLKIQVPTTQEGLAEREELATTPLLPPVMAEQFNRSTDSMQSPLQSPKVATSSAVASTHGTPKLNPVYSGYPTPPLSTKASMASLNIGEASYHIQPTSDIPPLVISEETDPWALKLGHANFHIQPEPYMPQVCSEQTCKRLRDDWEVARVAYMRQAARISEHYGPTSQTFRYTEQKWAEIDAKWRANHEKANATADVSAQSPDFQPLAEPQPVASMPVLNDPQQPAKFPAVSKADIVGPMVQVAKLRHPPAKNRGMLKILTDSASLLGGRLRR